MDVRIKATVSFSIGGGALEDSLAEYDELTVSGLLKEILDKAIACDGIQVEVTDLAATVARLKQAGCRFRNEIVTGMGGKQILVDDPSGNPVELFEPAPLANA